MRILEYARDPNSVRGLLERRWSETTSIEPAVRKILESVRGDGDAALLRLTAEFDCPGIARVGLRVGPGELDRAYAHVGKKFLKALRTARTNVKRFHRRQVLRSWRLESKGMTLEQRFYPLERVGIYIPGGKAAYPSTVLMNAIPAVIAGVREIAMVTPPDREGAIAPAVLVAAAECGVTEIYRVGGAQSVAALAFGTETIRPVDKITGPGNAYVAAAKRLLFGRVGIDSVAGPTEVVIIADQTANPEFVAADMIAQAEHDEEASSILLTTSTTLTQQVELELAMQLERSQRKAIVRASLDRHGAIVLVPTLKDAATIVNELCPEHLEVMVHQPERFARRITRAGAMFLGPWSTEAIGDYIAGPNHTLPTMGTARFSSALGVADFMRSSSVLDLGKKRFMKLAPHVETLAEAEGLGGHAASVRIRREHG
jgi:histidinol dehydrogenase